MQFAASQPAQHTSLVPQRMPSAQTFDVSWFPKPIQDYFTRNRAMSNEFTDSMSVAACGQWLETHWFRVSADLCIDGRVSDFSEVLGLPMGLLEMYRSGGCQDNTLDSLIYSSRNFKANEKYQSIMLLDGSIKTMCELRLVTVHHSSKYEEKHSCAAWNHETGSALDAMRDHAVAMNHAFRGTMVAIVALVNTDTDGLTVFGPGGSLDVMQYAESTRLQNGNLHKTLVEKLREIYPTEWEPLQALNHAEHRDAFHAELAELIEANIAFYRRVRKSGRPIELITHQERLIYIGRPLETRDHNEAFLIEDREREVVAANFQIGLKYVVANRIMDAAQADDRDWVIPVVINIPHTPSAADRNLTIEYARGIRHGKRIQHGLERKKPGLESWLKDHPAIVEGAVRQELVHRGVDGLPDWLERDLKNIPDHVAWAVCVSDRRNRLSIPCDIAA